MKTISILIKLNKNNLNQTLTEMGQFEAEKSILVLRLESIVDEINIENKSYHGSEYSFILEQYLSNARKRQDRVKAQIDRLEIYIEKKREILNEQYAELKKYEIALQNRQKQALFKAAKAEASFLNEFATNRYTYNKKPN